MNLSTVQKQLVKGLNAYFEQAIKKKQIFLFNVKEHRRLPVYCKGNKL